MDGFLKALGLGGGGRGAGVDPEAAERQALIEGATQPRMETVVVKSEGRSPGVVRSGSAADVTEQQQGGAGVPDSSPLKAPARSRTPAVAAGGGGGGEARKATPQWAVTAAYGITNLSSVVMIVVANKMVLFTHKFGFAVALTWLHSVFTAAGMSAMSAAGLFEHKAVPWSRTAPIAAVYVGFIVFNNLSIQLNPLGFYQMSKLAITPVLVAIEWFAYGKPASPRVLMSVAVLLVGITMCTVTDTQVSSNPVGILVAVAAVLVTSLYQVWAGTKQKELGLNGMQLLEQVSPISVLLLAVLIPVLEPVGWNNPGPGTILGYTFTPRAVTWIIISSVLGLVVTLSTFLFIGATSSLTYNVVGHLKTVLIVGAGVALFGDEMSFKKAAGLTCAMGGIIWYSQIKIEEARAATAKPDSGEGKGG